MRWVKRLLLGLLILALLLFMAVAGGVLALHSPGGQRFAVQQINKFGGDYIHLTGLSGDLPYDIKIAHLELIDPWGVWLSADQIELKWSPLALLRRHIAIESLTATTINLQRSPD